MKLEPCPCLCGGQLEIDPPNSTKPYWDGGCMSCGLSTRDFDSEEELITRWNTRPIEAKLREQIAELERSLDAALDQYAYQVNYNVELEQWQREAVPSLKWEIEKYHQPYLDEILEMVGESIPHVKPIRDRIAQLETLIKQAEENGNKV